MILTITDWAGDRVSLEPKVELYSVRDFMGKELPGLAIVLEMCIRDRFQSISAAASANDGYVIGVDVDQSGESDTVITSAMKGLSDAVQWAVGHVYDGTWDEIGGTATSLGVADNAVELPTSDDAWRFETFTVEKYEALYQQMVDGTLVVDDDYTKLDTTDWSNLTLTVI